MDLHLIKEKKKTLLLIAETTAVIIAVYITSTVYYHNGFTDGFTDGNKTGYESRHCLTECPSCECLQCKTCPPEKICPECPECKCPTPTTTPCPKCPECPECECANTEELLEKVNKDTTCRQTESPAWQDGCYTERCFFQELLGGNCSKFREARSNFDPGLFYSAGTQDIMDGYFCFRKHQDNKGYYFIIHQYPDENGRKRWSWNCDDTSTLRVNHL